MGRSPSIFATCFQEKNRRAFGLLVIFAGCRFLTFPRLSIRGSRTLRRMVATLSYMHFKQHVDGRTDAGNG